MRHAGGGPGRLAEERRVPSLHAQQQADRLVLAGVCLRLHLVLEAEEERVSKEKVRADSGCSAGDVCRAMSEEDRALCN